MALCAISQWKGVTVLTEPPPENAPPITELSRQQRRVLGVLLEKAFTTPDQYPLTPKALTSGCNQKSNRSPVVNYEEDQILDTLEQLRELGLIGEVHTDSGRTSRFRHYMRHRFTLTEPQLAILTELMLRGRQRLGELRTRASRMVPIDSLEQLRDELNGMMELNLLQTSGDLERRGTEVDHNLYRAKENMTLEKSEFTDDEPAQRAVSSGGGTAVASPPAASLDSGHLSRLVDLETALDDMRSENRDLRDQLESVQQELLNLQSAFEDLRRDLGG
ncbi:MAG: DUF480 domain-containing protein [Planctomycetaceae bacterium]|nr:DUF480 domain-containing protein [Planctomycetaceae bacterium]